MKERQKILWEKIRTKGQSEYILKTGGLLFGLMGFGIAGQLFIIAGNFIDHGNSFAFFDKEFAVNSVFRLLSAFPAGCACGWIIWQLSERNYLKATQKDK